MEPFKALQNIPQDLLLIHDLIGAPATLVSIVKSSHAVVPMDDSIDSSDSDIASEDEIAADLTAINDDDHISKTVPISDSSSESESDSDVDELDTKEEENVIADDDEEESGPTPASGTYFQTKNETTNADIVIPNITEIGPAEVLEKVGDIVTIMGNTVVINDIASDIAGRGSERALDSETLLVFEDRTVLGYIYETFGPTSQPLYQVKFNKEFPLDSERVKISREVFHVPTRSNFVFLSHLKKLKGSDASNVHDEEPAEHELEFSDDEAEASYKTSLKRRRGESRAHSVAASPLQSTLTPSQLHDHDMVDARHWSGNPYDEHGPYDIGFNAGPSRPPPIPYDDPYSDSYTLSAPPEPTEYASKGEGYSRPSVPRRDGPEPRGRGRNHGRDKGRSRGRGRGEIGQSRSFSRPEMQQSSRGSDVRTIAWDARSTSAQDMESFYGRHIARPLSPTSLAIAHATGQLTGGSNYGQPSTNFSLPMHAPNPVGAWGYPEAPRATHMFPFGSSGYPGGFVQPHINPRFANAFGMNFGLGHEAASSGQHGGTSYTELTSHPSAQSDWADEWAVVSAQETTNDFDQ